MVFYIHIPKTAGTSLLNAIKDRYASGELVLSYAGELAFWPLNEEFIGRIRQDTRVHAIYGHYGFGVHLLLGVRDPQYVTMLRDPVERIVSFYLHQARAPEARLYQAIHKGMSIRELIEGHLAPELNNFSIRILATDIGIIESHLGEDWPEYLDRLRWKELQPFVGLLNGLVLSPQGPYDQILNETHLQRALSNIDRFFSFIGVTEYMDESLRLLAKISGWAPPNAALQQLNTSSQQRPFLDDDSLDCIRRYNKLEYELYDKIKARFKVKL